MKKETLLKIGFSVRTVVFFLLLLLSLYALTNCVPAKKYRLLEADYQNAGEQIRILRQKEKYLNEYIYLDSLKKEAKNE